VRTSSPRETYVDEDAERRVRDALWAEFQASLSTPQPKPSDVVAPRMVKIEKRFRFAGEDVVEVKEVPEDSEDAKKWPRWQSPDQAKQTTSPVPNAASTADLQEAKQTQASSSGSSGATTGQPKAAAKRPGPRKPKTNLAPLPGSQKTKKLTTLDKSAMDWRAHVQTGESSNLKDELEANRRGGGYLEKVEFLHRVEERKSDALDATKTKRRRG